MSLVFLALGLAVVVAIFLPESQINHQRGEVR